MTAASFRTGSRVFSQSFAGSSTGRFFFAATPPAAAIFLRERAFLSPQQTPSRQLHTFRSLASGGKLDQKARRARSKSWATEKKKLLSHPSRSANMAPVVLVTGGSGLVGQGIRWQVMHAAVMRACERDARSRRPSCKYAWSWALSRECVGFLCSGGRGMEGGRERSVR
jgi:hypothetical protein